MRRRSWGGGCTFPVTITLARNGGAAVARSAAATADRQGTGTSEEGLCRFRLAQASRDEPGSRERQDPGRGQWRRHREVPPRRRETRRAPSLELPSDAPVLVSVGALVERKGFHRVMECLPILRSRHPGLRYLIVGGASPEGDWSAVLRRRAQELGLQDCVVFLGPLAPERLKVPLSAADVFVLATRNEGWANVFLEAMACGLPVVTTDVGGNAEVVCDRGAGNRRAVRRPGAAHRSVVDGARPQLESRRHRGLCGSQQLGPSSRAC